MISYDGLWNNLSTHHISQYALVNYYGISPSQITRLRHNRSVTTHTLNLFCALLNCEIYDLAEYHKDNVPVIPIKKRSRKHG